MNKYKAYDIYVKRKLIHGCYERISKEKQLIKLYEKQIKKIERSD